MTGPVDPANVVNTRQKDQEDLAESLRLLKEEFESMKRENEDQKKELKDLRENEGRGVARTATTTQVSVPKLRPGSTFKEFQRDVKIWKTTSLLPNHVVRQSSLCSLERPYPYYTLTSYPKAVLKSARQRTEIGL